MLGIIFRKGGSTMTGEHTKEEWVTLTQLAAVLGVSRSKVALKMQYYPGAA